MGKKPQRHTCPQAKKLCRLPLGQISVNLRVAKTIGFGREREDSGNAPRPGSGGNPMAAATGRGLGGLIGSPTTTRRYNLSIGMSVRNLFNHTNPGPITGNITSPYFGFANQIAGAQNGEGFYYGFLTELGHIYPPSSEVQMESKLLLLPSSPSYSNWWSPDVLPPPERESREGITTPTSLFPNRPLESRHAGACG